MLKRVIEKHAIPYDHKTSKTEYFVSLREYDDSGRWTEIDVERVFPSREQAENYVSAQS